MIETKDDIYIFSFFSGAGFLDYGFENSGFRMAFVNEYNKDFLKAYKFVRKRLNIRKPIYGYYEGDINDCLKGKNRSIIRDRVKTLKKKGYVGFIGGPPCPDFSIAGNNEGIDGNNGVLTKSYKRIILDQEPDFFLFENVKGLWNTKKHRVEYEKIKSAFSRKGYVLTDRIVNALDYGVPQDRERVLLFGVKYNLISANKARAKDIISTYFVWEGQKKYCADARNACNWPNNSPFKENSILPMPKKIIKELTVEYWFKKNDVNNHYNTNDYFSPHSSKFKTIAEGDVSRKSFKRLHRWRYSPTAAYGNNEVHIHPYKARRISVAEALAIQSLPARYVICRELSLSDQFKTVGNGVPYLMARQVSKNIYSFIHGYCNREIENGVLI